MSTDSDLADRLAGLSETQREEFLKRLPPAAALRAAQLLKQRLADAAAQGLTIDLMPHQRIPEPEDMLDGHVLAGGRGAGKSLASAFYISRVAERVPGLRARIIAPTLGDAVQALALDPQSGILALSPSAEFKTGGVEGARIVWPNKSKCFLVGTPTLDDVDRLRALTSIDLDCFEEAAANKQLEQAVKHAALSRRGLRLHHPIWIAATTPRPVPTYRAWLRDPRVTVTRASTLDNLYTPDSYRQMAASLIGTRTYKVEVLGELEDDVDGALWTQEDIERSLVREPGDVDAVLRTIQRVVVGVDPPTGAGTCGIVVVGVTSSRADPAGFSRIVVLDDFSITDATPGRWGQRIIDAFTVWGAYSPLVLAEKNQGGNMVASTIEQAAAAQELIVPVSLVTAKVSKEQRAQPVALLWEMATQRAMMAPPAGDVTRLAALTDQFLTWVPGMFSPDRLDACVHAAHYLMGDAVRSGGALQQPTAHVRPSAQAVTAASFRKALTSSRPPGAGRIGYRL